MKIGEYQQFLKYYSVDYVLNEVDEVMQVISAGLVIKTFNANGYLI